MRFFERWSGRRAADSSKGQFGAFAAKAAKDHASSEIALLDVMQVVDALAEALAKRFPELDQAAANDFAAAGLRLRCHRCGPLGGQAVHTLYLAGSGVLGESLATGPGAARLAQGRCPGCGSTTAVAEFFARDARDRAEQLRKVKRASRSEARGKAQLLPACPAIPYLGIHPYPYNHDFEVSPGGNLVCCLTTGGSLGAYEAGTDRLVWTAPVPATDECLFRFVGLDRLLVLSGPRNERGRILLINTSDGSVIDATNPIKLEYDVGDSDYRKGLFVGRETHRSLLFVDAAGDRIVLSPLRVDDQIDIGPRIGPDGHTYFGGNIWVEMHCVANGQDRVFCSKGRPYNCLCIGFESATRVYIGGGYYDRSGESALLITDPTTATCEVIGWGKEPIDEIACFGNGLLLLATATSKANPAVFPNAVISCFSAQNKQRVWTQSFVPSKPLRRVILATAPEQGWALVQTGGMFKVINVADGKVIRVLDKPSEFYVKASWVASRSLIYISGAPEDGSPGRLECYRF